MDCCALRNDSNDPLRFNLSEKEMEISQIIKNEAYKRNHKKIIKTRSEMQSAEPIRPSAIDRPRLTRMSGHPLQNLLQFILLPARGSFAPLFVFVKCVSSCA